ncbi:hypothetical protein SPURM210S_05163 [Streptomyces purpurascens]
MGAAARRVPLARPLTVAAQAVVTVFLLTFVFAREQALAGLVPGPEALDRFAILLRQGGDDIARYAIPAPLESDGIRLMLIGGVLIIGLLVDTLAVTFRSAAPAGLPLLALYSVAAGLSLREHGLAVVPGRGGRLSDAASGRGAGPPLPAGSGLRRGLADGRKGSRAARSPRLLHRPAHRRGRAGHRPGGPARPARDERRPAGLGGGRRRLRRGRREHDLRREPAGVAAGQPERGRGPAGPVREDRDAERLGPVSADRVPAHVRTSSSTWKPSLAVHHRHSPTAPSRRRSASART